MEEIGRQLRATRESRGISLEQAEEETKIRRKYIEALETGTKSDLPGEVYLKGFLRTYGNYLGLDGPAMVEEYKLASSARRSLAPDPAAALSAASVAAADLEDSPADRDRQLVDRERPVRRSVDTSEITPAVIRPSTGPSSSTLRTRKDGTPRPAPKRSNGRVRGVVLLVVVAAVLGAIGYYGWKVIGQFTKAPDKQADSAQTQGTTPPAPTTPTPTTPTTPTAPAPDPVKVSMTKGEGDQYLFAVNSKEVTVRLETTQRTWVQAMAGDKLLYDNFPVAPQEFRGASLRIRVGHMIGVTLYINGVKYDTGLKEGPYTFVFTGQ